MIHPGSAITQQAEVKRSLKQFTRGSFCIKFSSLRAQESIQYSWIGKYYLHVCICKREPQRGACSESPPGTNQCFSLVSMVKYLRFAVSWHAYTVWHYQTAFLIHCQECEFLLSSLKNLILSHIPKSAVICSIKNRGSQIVNREFTLFKESKNLNPIKTKKRLFFVVICRNTHSPMSLEGFVKFRWDDSTEWNQKWLKRRPRSLLQKHLSKGNQ